MGRTDLRPLSAERRGTVAGLISAQMRSAAVVGTQVIQYGVTALAEPPPSVRAAGAVRWVPGQGSGAAGRFSWLLASEGLQHIARVRGRMSWPRMWRSHAHTSQAGGGAGGGNPEPEAGGLGAES